MLLSILKALLNAYDNTIKEINKEIVEEKNEDTFKNKIEEKLKYATDNDLQFLLERENLTYMWSNISNRKEYFLNSYQVLYLYYNKIINICK